MIDLLLDDVSSRGLTTVAEAPDAVLRARISCTCNSASITVLYVAERLWAAHMWAHITDYKAWTCMYERVMPTIIVHTAHSRSMHFKQLLNCHHPDKSGR